MKYEDAAASLVRAGILSGTELKGFKDSFLAANDCPDEVFGTDLEDAYYIVAKQLRSDMWYENGRCPGCGGKEEGNFCLKERCDMDSWT